MEYDTTPVKDFRWWDANKNEAHDRVQNCIHFLRQNQTEQKEKNLRHMRLYGNKPIYSYSNTTAVSLPEDRLTLNVIRAVIDTITARIAKNRPHPTFLTKQGNHTLKRKARLLERYVESQFYITDTYDICPEAFIDAAVFGLGAVKIYREGTKVRVERTFPGELFVDPAESLYGEPRQLFQQKYISKEVLAALFPDKKRGIKNLTNAGMDDDALPHDRLSDQVLVTEAWHLPSGEGAKDGRHVITCDKLTLLDEDWTRDCFPFVFYRWSTERRGFWGQGIAEELIGIQVEINKLLQKIQKSFHLVAVPRVFVDAASRIQKPYLNNQIGAIIPYVGSKPEFFTPPSVNPEVFQHLWSLYEKAFEIEGVSMLTSTGSIPTGLEASGKAMLVHNEIETERFAMAARRWEKFYMQIADQIVELGREIARENPGYSVVAEKDRHTISEVKWEDIDLDRDAYVLKVFPTSILPTMPSGKLKFVQELIAAGMIPQEEGPRLLDFPDLDSFLALDRAMSEYIERVVENILDEGIYEAPEPFIDLQLAMRKMLAHYAEAVNNGVPEDRLEMMRDYMNQLKVLIRAVQQETANLQLPPGPAAPPAMTGAGVPITAQAPNQLPVR